MSQEDLGASALQTGLSPSVEPAGGLAGSAASIPSAVQQLYDNWGNRASAVTPEAILNGERVYKFGGYSITIPDDHDQPAKVANLYNKWGASENPMPNISFYDGEMRIPVEDFVDLILRRVPAEELAEGLWRDGDVRERFVYCMAHRYAGSIEDDDRRKLLNEIQVEIHARAIDRAIERLNTLESNARGYSNQYRWGREEFGNYSTLYDVYKTTLFEMREKGLLTHEQVGARLNNLTTPEQFKEYRLESADPVVRESVGKEWRESRDFWREKLEAFFPEPASGIAAGTDETPAAAQPEGQEPGPLVDAQDSPTTPTGAA